MRDFLEGVFDGAVTAFVIVAEAMMVASPTIIVAYLAYEKQSWELGVLAFAVFIMCIGVAMAIWEVTNERR
jgi:ABC-type nickel/cobalt efflux system permease component RcnA